VDEKSGYCVEKTSRKVGEACEVERIKKIDPVVCIKELNRMEKVYSDVTVEVSVVGSLLEQIRNGATEQQEQG
jgi:hypothetical protein